MEYNKKEDLDLKVAHGVIRHDSYDYEFWNIFEMIIDEEGNAIVVDWDIN